jgi:hypothetical protein
MLFPSVLHGITSLGSKPWLPLLLPSVMPPPARTPPLSCPLPACPSLWTATLSLLRPVAPHLPWCLLPASLSALLCLRPSASPLRRWSSTPLTWRLTTTPSGAPSSPWSSGRFNLLHHVTDDVTHPTDLEWTKDDLHVGNWIYYTISKKILDMCLCLDRPTARKILPMIFAIVFNSWPTPLLIVMFQ